MLLQADQNTKLINQPLDVISAAKSSAVNSERQSFAPFSEFEYDQQKQPAKENNFSVDKLNSFFVKRSERATFSSALRQYKALAHDDNTIKRTLKDLQMLVSEDILETHQSLIASLSSSYSVECMDCPLNYPETIIIGLTNCISIVKWEHLQEDELAIKDFMKKLTSIAFKYSNITILLLIESIEDEIDQRMLLGILQYLAKFPMTVSVRYWCENSDTLSNTVALLIKETVTLMKIGGRDSKDCSNTISSVKTQPYLHLLSDKVFSAHTEFLQLFPTINFSSAAMLLSQYTLHDLVEIVLVHFTENNSFEFASFLLQSMQFEHVYQFDLLVAQIVKLLQALVAHVGLAIIEM